MMLQKGIIAFMFHLKREIGGAVPIFYNEIRRLLYSFNILNLP